jgi:hypothetical protein
MNNEITINLDRQSFVYFENPIINHGALQYCMEMLGNEYRTERK